MKKSEDFVEAFCQGSKKCLWQTLKRSVHNPSGWLQVISPIQELMEEVYIHQAKPPK